MFARRKSAEAIQLLRQAHELDKKNSLARSILANALVAIPLSDAQIRRDLALVFRKDKSLSRAAKAFIEIAEKQKNFSSSATPAKRVR